MVYMISNVKRDLTGCGLHGYSDYNFVFNRSIQYSYLFLNNSCSDSLFVVEARPGICD